MLKYLMLFIVVNLYAEVITLGDACINISNTHVDKTIPIQLQKYYQKSTHHKLSIVSKNCEVPLTFKLVLLPTKMKVKPSVETFLSKVKNDAFSIYHQDQTIYIVANNSRSLLYGVYSFIQNDLGVLFLTAEYEKIKHINTLDFSRLNRNSEARFNYREIFVGEVDDATFAKKMALNGRFGHRKAKDKYFTKIYNAFTPYELLPPNKYRHDYASYYCAGQLDYSSKNVQKEASTNLIAKVNKLDLPQETYLNLPHQDRHSYCKKNASKYMIQTYKSPAAPYLSYVEHLANDIALSNSHIRVMAEAYQWSRKPPKGWHQFPNNMGLFFSTIEADFSKPLDSAHNKKFIKDLKGWTQYTDNITIWHYITNYNGYFQPFPDVEATIANISYWSNIQEVNGVFLQGAYGTYGGDRTALKVWLYSQLLWNPTADVKALEKTFIDAYYGAAADEITAYYDVLDRSIKETDDKLYVKTSINADYLNTDVIREAHLLLDSALKKTVNKVEYKHVLSVYAGIDYIDVMRGSVSNEGKKRLKKYLTTPQIKLYAEGRKKNELIKFISFNRKSATLPSNINVNDKWKDFQEYALKLCCTQLVEDDLASDNSAAMMSGSRSDWGFQLALNQLEKGQWDIFANVRVVMGKELGLLDQVFPAFYYGVYGKRIKNTKLISSYNDEKYHEVLIGRVNVVKNDAANVWIRPPKDRRVKNIYVDRIYAVRK